ncbi:hypothetical protein FDENT_11101 [Fusarium denticulatum]|uniref:Uncharacterized protein n=1 Tax=Fusarium denticulatum TaxID=48507 RepID=A0A8H5TGX9_9HYPO|nr:hypothetical protein FDENT_11101 [Fusarium denticulatum]
MEALKNAEALPIFPSSPADALDGKYGIRSAESGYVESYGSDIEGNNWFQTPTRTVYGMSVTNLYLLGGTMVVSGQGTYTPASGANQPTIAVDGKMKMLSLSTEPFTIDVSLTVTPDKTNFSLTGAPPGPLQKPFGTMFNVEIKLATITGFIKHTEPKNAVYTLQGSGTIGASTLQFASLVVFDQDLKPTVVALQLLSEQLTSSDVSTHIIQPGSETNPSWPEGYSVLGFKGAIVYYASKDVDAYKQGYHVKALASFFGCDFTISARVPLNQTHLTVDATYQGTIDLLFAQLDKATLSIITAKDAKDTVWEAKADLTLFMKKGFHISLKYKRGLDLYSATGSYQGSDTILGYSNPTVAMTYDNKTKRMSIDNWPTRQTLKDILSTTQFAEALKKASARDMKCEEIVELVFKETITTDYNVKFKSASVNDSGLELIFQGTRDIQITNPETKIAEIPLSDIALHVPKDLSMDKHGVAVVQMLLDNIASIALKLLQQPEKLMAFFGALVVKEYVQKTITALICRKANTSNIRERADELVNQNESDVESRSTDINREVSQGISSTTLDVAGGAFITAEGILDGLVTTFGLLASLAGVYGAMTPDQAAKLQDKVARAKKQKEEAEAKVAQLEQHLADGITLDPQVPITAMFKDDETILLDWSKVTIKLRGDESSLSWDMIFSQTQSMDDPSAIKMFTNSPSRTYQTPPIEKFLVWQSVWAWVRARATFGKTLVHGPWHPVQTVHHVPCISPPKEVTLEGAPTINGTFLIVSMSVVVPGDYLICIVTQDDPAASSPLYSTSTHTVTASTFTKKVRVVELGLCSPTTTGIRAVAKTLSSDPARYHDSPFTSSQSLDILPPPRNLTASMAGLTVMATCDLPGQSQDDCELAVLDGMNSQLDTMVTVQFLPAQPGHRLASVQGPSLQDGYHMFLLARQKSTKDSVIGMYDRKPFVVADIPLWTIDAVKTYYDIPSNSITLNINSARRAGELTFEVLLSGATTVTPSSTSLSDQTAVLTIPNIRDPYPVTVQVWAISASHTRGIWSTAWNFPSVPQDLPAPQPKISYAAGILTLTWPAIPVANVRVLVWVQDSKTAKVLSTKSTTPSATSLIFSSLNFSIVPGMSLIFNCSSGLDNIQGLMTRVLYEIPDMNKGWGTPRELIIPAPQTKITYSAVTTYSVPYPMDSTLFWASSSAKTITGLDWNTGNCITHTSRPGHRELFYLKQDGTIADDYAFAAETANLNHGGVIDAVSLNSTTSLLCWVARDGAIRYSVWGGSTKAWSVANYAAGPQAATITEAGFIRATSQDGKGVQVFYLGKGGEFLGVFCYLVSDTGSMVWKGFKIQTDPDTRPRGSALSVSGVGTPIRIFWSSATGRVVEAHRDGDDLDSWKVQSVTSPGSVGTSNMTAVYRDNATVCLWWITPAGAICRGDRDISTRGKISDWTVTKQLPDGTALSATAGSWPPAVTSDFYTASHSSVMSIFWVSPDQVLMGQTWSQEH